MNLLNDDRITLFQSGIGDGNDLLLGFPSYEQLLEDGQEIFDIFHRLKGFDSSKVITYYPLNNFLYMVKANYKVKKLSEFGLIDFRVDLLKPHNYKFKLIANVTDDLGVFTKEWVCEGTIDRDAQDYTIVEFDEEVFLPEDVYGNKYSGSAAVQYEIQNILGDTIIRVCFDDDTTLSERFQFIKAKTFDDTPFIYNLLQETNFVASPATEYINFQRRQLNNIIMKKWLYPDIKSNLDIDYLCKETIHGILLEYGVKAHVAAGMDFPYKYILTFTNPFIGDKKYEFEDFYHNILAGDSEIIKNLSLAEYERIPYNPDIHGLNDIKDFSYNVNLPPSIKILDPEFINKNIQLLSIDSNDNKINMNNVKTMNTFGLAKFSTLGEKEIVFEYVYDNKLFRIFKVYEIRKNDPLFTTKCMLRYETLDLATLSCITSSIIDISDDDDVLLVSNSRLTNDYVVEARNIFVVKDKVYMAVERFVDYIHKFDNADIDNTPYRYEIIQVCINLFSGGFTKNTLISKDYSIEVLDYEELVTTSWVNSGKTKFIIIPSCRADVYFDKDNPADFRFDILFKQIQAHKATYDNTSIGGGTSPEQFTLYYCSANYTPTLIYSSTTEPLMLDFADTIGVCSSENHALFYYKTIQRGSLMDLGYQGVEVDLRTADTFNIDFRCDTFMKVLNVRGQYLIIKEDFRNINCAKMNIGLTADVALTHTVLSNNDYTYSVTKDIMNDTIFNSRDGINNSYLNIGELVSWSEFRYLNRNLILKDRFHTKYIVNATNFISTKSKGDFLDFIINYNSSQIEIDEDKIVWFGTVNDYDNNGDTVVYTTRYEFITTGFDSLATTDAIYFNLFTLMVTPLFDLYYKEKLTGKYRTYTGEIFEYDTDIIYDLFVFNKIAFMYNHEKDIYIYFDSDIFPSKREEYITELTFCEYTILLPENGYLISVDIKQRQAMMFWEKSSTISVRLLDDIDRAKTRKNVPVDQRVKIFQYKMTFYNFTGIVERIDVRYATKMLYDIGDLISFTLKSSSVDFFGSNVTLNRTYARLFSSVQIVQGERVFQIIAYKLKDMDYTYELKEEVVFFEDGGSTTYQSPTLLPLCSINNTEYEYFVDNGAYTLTYMRDYADAEDYLFVLPYSFADNVLNIENNIAPKTYLLDFTGNLKDEVEVNKRDVFDKFLDGRDFDKPKFKKFILPFTPTNFSFTYTSSNVAVKLKSENFFIYYYTNYEEIGEEKPKALEATKLGGHTNTYLYWQDNPAEIAKKVNSHVRTTTDEVLCIEAVEEEIIVDGEVYTRWFYGSVNGLDDNGNIVDPVMLSDDDYAFDYLKNQGKADISVRVSSTNIQDLLPPETVTTPTFTIIMNNPRVDYVFATPTSDVGLTNKETRQLDATINFFSNHSTKINLAEETYTVEKYIKGCIITNSEAKKEFIVELDNPLYSSFYYDSETLATTIDTFMPYLISTSENIVLRIDYVKTLLSIDPLADIFGKTDEDLWLMILAVATQSVISLYIIGEIVFPEQVSWNPNLNLGTYYLNNQEFELLPDTSNKIFLASSDLISFSTVPLPDEFSPIILINEITGKEYQRVYFKDKDNNFTLTNEQEITFDDCWRGVLLNENVDIQTINMSEHRDLKSVNGTILELANPIEADKIIKITYQLCNSFCVNIDTVKNRAVFMVHSTDENAKFKIKYTGQTSMASNINANPLTSINRGFVQLGGNK